MADLVLDAPARLCRGCGAPLTRKPGPGRWPHWCSTACKPKQVRPKRHRPRPAPKGERLCEWCGKVFGWHPKNRTRFCSRSCAWDGRAIGSECVIPWVECPCGRWFVRRGNRRFCSPQCAQRVSQQRATEKAQSWREVTCGRCGAKWMRAPAPGGQIRCQPCRETERRLAKQRQQARKRAASKSEQGRERHREAKRRRRAAKLGGRSERYSTSEIFERDGWRCKLCSRLVNRTAVVPHPKAPVIDHILPLSLGGDDLRANVQCAHFLCNSVKSAGTGPNGDQLRLLG